VDLQLNSIDDFTDVSEKDKEFFKLWGKFMSKKYKYIYLFLIILKKINF
jgi:hypothetical protein